MSVPAGSAKKLNRYVPSAPIKVLDAPELMNDYYLNLLSWGSSNVLAVALGQSVYLWNAETGEIDELMSLEGDEYISSVSWSDVGGSTNLAIGTSESVVQLWDVAASKQIRSMGGHSARVGALAWNSFILSSGSRDSTIIHHDVRSREHHVATLSSHEQEVCGLQWSPDRTTLASGGNDNALCLWRAAMMSNNPGGVQEPAHRLEYHTAAVKAIAWCPWERNLLATGGGTADRTIKFWNTANGALLNSVDAGSQVCSLLWSTTEKELLSSHGYSQNELCLWKYPSMTKVKELTGHTSRVLHLAASPDGSTVVSGAADETLRFWKVFGPSRKPSKSVGSSGSITSSFSSVMSIR
jgi:cell division cycle protein 20 (cofactor of APC complex)